MKSKLILAVAAAASLFSACSKEKIDTQEKGNVTMNFRNYAGDEMLALGAGLTYRYRNANGDSFNVTNYKYYISNIKLVGSEGIYAQPESYHLLDASDPTSLVFTMSGVPAGTYNSVKLLLGVDSLRNVSGAQTGALDPLHGMFWTWTSGYIMAKIEGVSPQSTEANRSISFHLGGFQGPYSVLNEVSLDLPEALVVGNNTYSGITLKSDVLKWFEAPNLIRFSTLSQLGSAGEDAFKVAKNYSHSLSVTEVQN